MLDIIIPAFNSHGTINRTIESICQQENANEFKVYIVDDGSTEPYDYLYENYRDKLNLTIFRLDENKGPGYAREYAMNRSNSKYIMFIDSDDVLYATSSVKEALKYMENHNYDAVSGRIEEDYYGKKYDYFVGFDTLHGKIYRRDFICNKKITFPHIYNSEDIAFNNLVIMNSNNIGQCDLKLYVYQRRKNSLTQTEDYESKHIRCYCESLKWTLDRAVQCGVNKSSIGRLLKSCFSYFYYYYENRINEPSINNIIKFIPMYEEYQKYIMDFSNNYWLDFWTIKISTEGKMNNYLEFISFCRNKYENL